MDCGLYARCESSQVISLTSLYLQDIVMGGRELRKKDRRGGIDTWYLGVLRLWF